MPEDDAKRQRFSDYEDLKKAYQGVFASAAGRAVLEDLCAPLRQVRGPTKEYANIADARAFNDGQRSMALRILAMLEAPGQEQ